jgi:hypothetical protein
MPGLSTVTWLDGTLPRSAGNLASGGDARGLGTSHVPMIGRTIAANRQQEVSFRPFFDAFGPVHEWLARVKPDVVIVLYNDHGLNFALDNMPTFAIGAADSYENADEGWGAPEQRSSRGAPELSWHTWGAGGSRGEPHPKPVHRLEPLPIADAIPSFSMSAGALAASIGRGTTPTLTPTERSRAG